MPARVISGYTVTRAGSGKSNQDNVITAPHALAVLDGASGEKTHHRDGGWYVEQLAKALSQSLRQPASGRGLRAILRDAIGEVAAHMGDDRPSSAVGLARWGRLYLELLVLGDVTAVAFTALGGVEVLTDDRLDTVAPQLRGAYQEHLRAGHGFDARHRTNLAELQAAQLAKRNIANGYWIAEADPAAADHAFYRKLPLQRMSALLMVTDGIAKAITHYRLFDWPTAQNIIVEKGPEELIDEICRAEEADPDGFRWPRGKHHDDKTLAYFRFGT